MMIPNLTEHVKRTEREVFNGDDWAVTSSGVAVPSTYVPPARMTAVDLFSGAGGFSLGLMQAGVNVLAGVEHAPDAAVTYLANIGANPMKIHPITDADGERLEAYMNKHIAKKDKKTGLYKMSFMAGDNWPAIAKSLPAGVNPIPHFFFGDIRKLSGKKMLEAMGLKPGDINMVVGGPPCQGFSSAGKRNVMDPRNSLVFDFARIVLELQPDYIVMENVPEIVSMITPEGVPVIDAFCRMLESGNYGDYDMLKKSLTYGIDTRAAVRNGGKSSNKKEAATELVQRQMELF